MRSDAKKSVQRIVEAATRLLAESPEASIQAIAEESGVHRATLYRHFPTRTSLVIEIRRRALDEAESTIAGCRPDEGPALEAIRRLTTALIGVGDRYRVLVRLAEVEPDLQARLLEVGVPLVMLVARAQQEGVIARDVSPAWATRAWAALIVSAIRAAADGSVPEGSETLAVERAFLEGFAPPGPRGAQRSSKASASELMQ